MSDYAIKVENLSKEFKLPHNKKSSLKQVAIGLVKRDTSYEVQQALKDVSFEIKKGEFFGVVGRNGSGKSTLLKIMAGVYTPTGGGVKINGSLVPFIELGVGFNPELSGRDNVFLNGALLGFSRKEMEEMYDEIVEFAELEKFMDQKLKNYSSGMQVRLAFSIAIKAKGDILVLDEVLAVGDEAFQKKCLDVFEKYKASNKTIVLVTHSMAMVEKYCDRALLLKEGLLKDIGDSTKIAAEYSMLNVNEKKPKKQTFENKTFLKNHGISYKIVKKETNEPSRKFDFGETVEIKVSWKSKKIKNIGVALKKASGEYIFGPNTIADEVDITKSKQVTYRLRLDLGNGSYRFLIAFFGETAHDRLHFIDKDLDIEIVNSNQGWSGIVRLNSEWIV